MNYALLKYKRHSPYIVLDTSSHPSSHDEIFVRKNMYETTMTNKYDRSDKFKNRSGLVCADWQPVHCTANHDPSYIRQLFMPHNVWDET